MDVNYTDVIIVKDSKALGRLYDKIDDMCKRYKNIMKDKFEYKIDADYEKLELTFEQFFTDLPDEEIIDDAEGDPQLN